MKKGRAIHVLKNKLLCKNDPVQIGSVTLANQLARYCLVHV